MCFACTCLASNQDIGLNFTQTAELHGYQVEEHFVTTSDGYILRLFRISHGLNDTYEQGRPAILFQHGIFESVDSFLIRGTDLSVGFYIANRGYDTWYACMRGNEYSRNHTTLDPDADSEFWDYSFPEMMYDHQANIEYILNSTGLSSISFYGFSIGATSMFVGLVRENEWFSQRVNLFVSVVQILRNDGQVGFAAQGLGSSLPWELLRRNNIYEIYPNNFDESVRDAYSVICRILPQLCNVGLNLISYTNAQIDNVDAAATFATKVPAGLSIRAAEHLAQLHENRRFQDFDFGAEENMARYGNTTPPVFDVSEISGIPIALFFAGMDDEVGALDNQWLIAQLEDVLVFDTIYQDYAHFDFYVAEHLDQFLDDVIDLLSQYGNA